MDEIIDFVNVGVSRSRDRRCLALVDGERIVHLDGTPDFFETLCAAAAEVAGTLRANDCGDDPMGAVRRHISRVLSMIAESDVFVPESGRLSWSCGGIDCQLSVFADSGWAWLGVLAKGATAKKRAKAVEKANAINASGLNQIKVLAHRKAVLVVGEIPVFPWLQAMEVECLIERVAGTTRKMRANF